MNLASSATDSLVEVLYDNDAVVVRGDSLQTDRHTRLYFESLLGGTRVANGWRVPLRRRPRADVALQINTYLVRRGFAIDRDPEVEASVRRDEERRRSFERTREFAEQLRRDGLTPIKEANVTEALESVGWNFQERTLRDHQMLGVIHGLTVGNGANFSVPGAGKTATTLALASVHWHANTIDAVLVVGPLSCFRPWESEAALATPWLRARRIRGDSSARRLSYRSVERGDLSLVSFATAAADQTQLIAICQRLRVMLVVDESHRVKRFRGGTWAPALVEIARHAAVRAILSGTPMPQSGRDLYSQLNILWPGRELTGPRDSFAVQVRDRFEQVLDRVLPFAIRTPKAALGLDPPVVRVHSVELSDEEADIYRLVEANLLRRAQAAGPGEQARLDALRRGRPIRLLQAAANPDLLRRADPSLPVPRVQGIPTLLERLSAYDSRVTPPSKSLRALELLAPIVAERRKAVVWGNFITNLDQFSRLAAQRLEASIFQVDGRVPTSQDGADAPASTASEVPETREQVIASFLAHDGPGILVANPASCSESISLHSSCHVAVYLDRTYDCAQWLQSIDRIHRLGLPTGVVVEIHVLEAVIAGATTADGLVRTSLSRKESVMRQLLEGADIAPLGQAEDPIKDAEGDDLDLRELLAYLLGAERG